MTDCRRVGQRNASIEQDTPPSPRFKQRFGSGKELLLV